VAVDRIDAHRQHLDLVVGVPPEVVPDSGELALTGSGEGQGVEDQQHRLAVVEVPQAYHLIVLVFEREIGGR